MNSKIKSKHEMNKLNNNHYIKVSIQFSFWCNFIQIIIYHFGIIIKTGFLGFDVQLAIFLFLIFLIQSGIYLLCYGLGRLFDFNIRPLIIFISFGDFLFISVFTSILSGIGSGDEFGMFKDYWWYFILLFLSKFLLIYFLEKGEISDEEQN
ncbi:MAG: hypothetical protein IKQ46_02180 [Bacteroidales bacterium]|nr:hypothetical protein [Bacteroidales bacterium]